MIPRIIHQTWRDAAIPERFHDMVASWKARNPGWDYRLWTDADLDALVAEHYPEFLEIFRSYPNPVQRADAGRYLALHRHGGVYADLDTTCLASFEPLAGEDRLVFSCEPDEQAEEYVARLHIDWLICNAVMASPANHPFWVHVLETMVRCRHASDVLESTGPLMLTGSAMSWRRPDDLAVSSCHLFDPLTSSGKVSESRVFGPHAQLRLSVHHWAGSWYSSYKETVTRRLKGQVRQWRTRLFSGPSLNPEHEKQRLLSAGLPDAVEGVRSGAEANIAIFVPIRNAARHVATCMKLIRGLDHPAERIKLAFCVGDSNDGTEDALAAALQGLEGTYRDIRVLRQHSGVDFGGKPRWHPSVQRKRRAAIARARNHLIENALTPDDDWVLWIDADVCDYPADIVARLMAAGKAIVVPDCVTVPGGPSFDLNSFLDTGPAPNYAYYKCVRDGLFQPPVYWHWRKHLHDLRYLDRVPLSGVGGTMLLVAAAIHRAGLVFPERPYRHLIETEAFGQLARDCGVTPFGLPNIEIRHVSE
jgi:GT2 family glycosyltransferase